MNHISVHAAITDWCNQFGLTIDDKEQVATPVDNGPLTMMDPVEVDMLVSPPNVALGNKMHGYMRFQTLDKMVHMTKLCEKKPYPSILSQQGIFA